METSGNATFKVPQFSHVLFLPVPEPSLHPVSAYLLVPQPFPFSSISVFAYTMWQILGAVKAGNCPKQLVKQSLSRSHHLLQVTGSAGRSRELGLWKNRKWKQVEMQPLRCHGFTFLFLYIPELSLHPVSDHLLCLPSLVSRPLPPPVFPYLHLAAKAGNDAILSLGACEIGPEQKPSLTANHELEGGENLGSVGTPPRSKSKFTLIIMLQLDSCPDHLAHR